MDIFHRINLQFITAVLPLLLSVGSSDILNKNFRFSSLPGLHQKSYSRLGDINVGALVLTDRGTAEGCDQKTKLSPIVLEHTEAVAFAVDVINNDTEILPNVTLGFVVQGTCNTPGPILGSSLLFIPQNKKMNSTEGSTHSNNQTLACTEEKTTDGNASNADVIGVMSVGLSLSTKPVSQIYAVATLPLIGPTETMNEFSNKKTHPYFLRMSPSQKFLIKAMLKLISEYGWSYISVIYSDCSFSFSHVIDEVESYGICIASKHRVTSGDPDVTNNIVLDLLSNPKARVVLILVKNSIFEQLLLSAERHNAKGHFIWVGYNSLDSYFGFDKNSNTPYRDPAIGTFYVDTYSKSIPEFYSFLDNQRPRTSQNPWLKDIWEYLLDCTVKELNCNEKSVLQSSKYRTYKGTALRVDAILTLAHAAHDLLSERCPDARGKEARACITGPLLLQYLKNVDLKGFVNHVKFDKNQDIQGKFHIKQIVYDYQPSVFLGNETNIKKNIFGKIIGEYDTVTGNISYVDGAVSWSHLNVINHFARSTEKSFYSAIPESTCSKPCLSGEYKIEKRVPCCWECRRCRDNERFVNGNTSCESCPEFTWPDPSTGRTSCYLLPSVHSTIPDAIPTVLVTASVVALLATFSTALLYVKYRDKKIIKASSKELSAIQLVAISTGYTTVILFQTAPSDEMCRTLFALFCMSFAMLYCPLLAKTSRIFRIFRSGSLNRRPRFISSTSQLVFTGFLLTIQIGMCVITYILYSPKSQKIQPIWTEKLVELSCDLTLPGLASFLCYNLVLVSLCSVFAFLTRTLPDNFNESKFIAMCVSTTLLIWLAFIPTYFTAGREMVRVFLLSTALLLNHSVALCFLFLPKIYAAAFLPASDGRHVSDKF